MKIIFYILSIGFPFYAFGQLDFAPVGAKWTYESKWGDWITGNIYYSLFIIESEKDTIIQNKEFKKLSCYFVNNDIAGNKIRNYKKNQFVYQDNYKVHHLVKDSIIQIFDFNPAIGLNHVYWGWNIIADQPNFSQIEYQVVKSYRDSSYPFLPNRIEAEITCSVSQGNKILIYEKFGYLSDALFYTDAYCVTDQYLPFTLRCYQDPDVGIVKFDSIDCDSIRLDIIRISTNEEKDFKAFNVYQSNENILLLINNTNVLIEKINLLNSNGNLIQSNKIYNSESDQAIKLNSLIPGIYFVSIQLAGGKFFSDKVVIH